MEDAASEHKEQAKIESDKDWNLTPPTIWGLYMKNKDARPRHKNPDSERPLSEFLFA